jgi:hypothetical protein
LNIRPLSKAEPQHFDGKQPTRIRPAGLEPATPGLGNRCSILLSYGRIAFSGWSMLYEYCIVLNWATPPATKHLFTVIMIEPFVSQVKPQTDHFEGCINMLKLVY